MIKNLIVGGCSFTQTDHNNWSLETLNHYGPMNHINLARPAAGNFYISDSLIQCLMTEKLNPEETLVLIMWSGVGRTDIIVSDEFYKLVKPIWKTSCYDRNYVFSGGLSNWQTDKDSDKWFVAPIFDNIYKTQDYTSLAKNKLSNIIKTKDFLIANGYNFEFMSYVDYWQDTEEILSPNLDFSITYYNGDDIALKNLSQHWIWTNKKTECFYEYARRKNLISSDNFHPSEEGHVKFAKDIVIPSIKKYFE